MLGTEKKTQQLSFDVDIFLSLDKMVLHIVFVSLSGHQNEHHSVLCD